MIKFTIQGQPLSKKNDVQFNTYTKVKYKSKRIRSAESNTISQMLTQKTTIQYQSLYKYNFPLTDILEIEYKFYRGDKRKCDLSNLIELPNDCLQSAGIIADDCQIYKITAYKYYSKDNPHTDLFIKLITIKEV